MCSVLLDRDGMGLNDDEGMLNAGSLYQSGLALSYAPDVPNHARLG